MPLNLELKAHLSDPNFAEQIARRLGARFCGSLRQTDTYFVYPKGRLKLREAPDGSAELILYTRPNDRKERYSDYRRVPVPAPRMTKKVLGKLFGILTVVRKVRKLFLYRNARIHIDRVKALGSFIEFEVPVTKGHPEARSLMKHLQHTFQIQRGDIVADSYSDHMINKDHSSRSKP